MVEKKDQYFAWHAVKQVNSKFNVLFFVTSYH